MGRKEGSWGGGTANQQHSCCKADSACVPQLAFALHAPDAALAPPFLPCSAGAGAAAKQQQQQQSAVSFPYPGSLCLHATERRQQEFEFDSVFSGESSQVGLRMLVLL